MTFNGIKVSKGDSIFYDFVNNVYTVVDRSQIKSFNGRSDHVLPEENDYSIDQIDGIEITDPENDEIITLQDGVLVNEKNKANKVLFEHLENDDSVLNKPENVQNAVDQLDYAIRSLQRGAVFAGTYDAENNLIIRTTGAGSQSGFFVEGQDLPVASIRIDTYFVLVNVAGEYDGIDLKIGDKLIVDGDANNYIKLEGPTGSGEVAKGGMDVSELELNAPDTTLQSNKIYMIYPDQVDELNNIVNLPTGQKGDVVSILDPNNLFKENSVVVASDKKIDGFDELELDLDHCFIDFIYSDLESTWKTRDATYIPRTAGGSGGGEITDDDFEKHLMRSKSFQDHEHRIDAEEREIKKHDQMLEAEQHQIDEHESRINFLEGRKSVDYEKFEGDASEFLNFAKNDNGFVYSQFEQKKENSIFSGRARFTYLWDTSENNFDENSTGLIALPNDIAFKESYHFEINKDELIDAGLTEDQINQLEAIKDNFKEVSKIEVGQFTYDDYDSENGQIIASNSGKLFLYSLGPDSLLISADGLLAHNIFENKNNKQILKSHPRLISQSIVAMRLADMDIGEKKISVLNLEFSFPYEQK